MNQALTELNNVNILACQLVQEVQLKLKNESYQFQSIELSLLELLACHQQKYQQLIVINAYQNKNGYKVPLTYQRTIIEILANIIEQWQQNKAITRLEIALHALCQKLNSEKSINYTSNDKSFN